MRLLVVVSAARGDTSVGSWVSMMENSPLWIRRVSDGRMDGMVGVVLGSI